MEAAIRNSTHENFQLDLAPGWCLRADPLQWMLYRERSRRGQSTWQPIAFVGSNKRMLARVMAREGLFDHLDLQPAVHTFLSASPQSFKKWSNAFGGE